MHTIRPSVGYRPPGETRFGQSPSPIFNALCCLTLAASKPTGSWQCLWKQIRAATKGSGHWSLVFCSPGFHLTLFQQTRLNVTLPHSADTTDRLLPTQGSGLHFYFWYFTFFVVKIPLFFFTFLYSNKSFSNQSTFRSSWYQSSWIRFLPQKIKKKNLLLSFFTFWITLNPVLDFVLIVGCSPPPGTEFFVLAGS